MKHSPATLRYAAEEIEKMAKHFHEHSHLEGRHNEKFMGMGCDTAAKMLHELAKVIERGESN